MGMHVKGTYCTYIIINLLIETDEREKFTMVNWKNCVISTDCQLLFVKYNKERRMQFRTSRFDNDAS